MLEQNYVLLGIIGMGVVTFIIRIAPALHIIPSSLLKRLEAKQAIFPPMFLTLLVIYCLAPVREAIPAEGTLLLGCAGLVGILHWLKGNLFLSLGSGTAIYLYFMNYY